jgi:hypothetical protein
MEKDIMTKKLSKKISKKIELAAALLLLSVAQSFGMEADFDGRIDSDEPIISAIAQPEENGDGMRPEMRRYFRDSESRPDFPDNTCEFPERAWVGDGNVWQPTPAMRERADGAFVDQDGQVYREWQLYDMAEQRLGGGYYHMAPEGSNENSLRIPIEIMRWWDYRLAEKTKAASQYQKMLEERERLAREKQELEQQLKETDQAREQRVVELVNQSDSDEPLVQRRGTKRKVQQQENKRFKCRDADCSRSFQQEAALYVHELNKHGMAYQPYYDLQRLHAMQPQAVPAVQAPVAPKNSAKNHWVGPKPFKCLECRTSRTFAYEESYREHMDMHAQRRAQLLQEPSAASAQKFQCLECPRPRTFSIEESFIQHQAGHALEREEREQELRNGQLNPQPPAPAGHQQQVGDPVYYAEGDSPIGYYNRQKNSYVCVHCDDMQYQNKRGLQRHFESDHVPPSEWRYQCEYCLERFPRSENLIAHRRKSCQKRIEAQVTNGFLK